MRIANDDPSFAIEPDYYRKAVTWDSTLAQTFTVVMTDLRGNVIFPFDLRRYNGAKVPFLAAGRAAHGPLLELIQRNP